MITYLLFSYISLCFGLVSLYFIWRFILYRRLPSLICATLPVGWILVIARELRWWPRNWTTPLIALAATVGTLSVLLIANYERQRQKPFR